MTPPNDVAVVVLAVAQEVAGAERQVSLETPLFEGGLGLDSIGGLDFILKVEGRLGVRLRDEDLTETALSTLGTLVAHIGRVRAR